jgi:hypothetical protein
MLIALGQNHRRSGVTLKAQITWVLPKTAFATSVLRLWIILVNALIFVASRLVHKIIHRWKSVVSKGFVSAFSFAKRDNPNRAALQPCLDGPELTSGQQRSGGFIDD